MNKRFVLLDRDGTIIIERNYLSHPDQVELIPRAAEGLKLLAELGLGLLIVTNQSGITRGYFDEVQLTQIHRRMCDLLAAHGVRLDGIYFCPHTPEDNCSCRKPRAGLVTTAAKELGFDPTESFIVGDKPCDIDLGRRIGAGTFLVRTGYGRQHELEKTAQADYVVDDILGASQIIAQMMSGASRTN